MHTLKIFIYLTAMALVAASTAFAADDRLDPNNPNCSPGVKGCTANYPTSDVTKQNPATPGAPQNAASPMNPNCTHGERDCSANYPTSDVTKKNPATQK